MTLMYELLCGTALFFLGFYLGSKYAWRKGGNLIKEMLKDGRLSWKPEKGLYNGS